MFSPRRSPEKQVLYMIPQPTVGKWVLIYLLENNLFESWRLPVLISQLFLVLVILKTTRSRNNCVKINPLFIHTYFNLTGIRNVFMCDHSFLVFFGLEESEWFFMFVYFLSFLKNSYLLCCFTNENYVCEIFCKTLMNITIVWLKHLRRKEKDFSQFTDKKNWTEHRERWYLLKSVSTSSVFILSDLKVRLIFILK